MATRTEEYATMSREMLEKGQQALVQEDLVQASEKLWGAAAQMVESVAERRGWDHRGHRELFKAIGRIANESGDASFRDLFHVANSLHSNFYEHWMSTDFVELGLDRVEQLISKLEAL